ncbi:MAG: hypothetical protein KGJ13_09195, partial [Patescibacteria group bacterium]|nr:hypothetical protein [Patescibacteria group bacterium]
NWGSIPAKLFKSKWFHLDAPRHLFLFNKETLVRILEKNGFKVRFVKYDGDTKDIINHFSYLFQGKIPRSRNVIAIELLRPVNAFLKKIKMSDVLIVHAVKDSNPSEMRTGMRD